MKSVATQIITYEVVWLSIVTPFLFFPNSTFGAVMLAIPLLWGVRRWATGHFIHRTPFDGVLLLLLAMVGVSQWVTPNPLFSLSKVAGVVLGVGWYYALVALPRRRSTTPLLIGWLVVVSLGIALLSLVSTEWVNKLPVLAPIIERLPRTLLDIPGSPIDGFNPNTVAGTLLLVLPLLLILVSPFTVRYYPTNRAARSLGTIGLFVVLCFIGAVFLLTQSRAGYGGAVVGVGTLLLLPRPKALAGVLVVGVIVVALFALSPYRTTVAQTLESEGGGTATLIGRVSLWQRAVQGIKDFPVTGMGMGMFRYVQPRLYPLYIVPPQEDVGHAHNQWLQAGLDVGVPGLIAYIALWLGIGLITWQTVTTPSVPPLTRVLIIGLAAGWVAHFIWALIETNALGSKGGFLWWLSLGTIVALYQKNVPLYLSDNDKATL